jgi:peroxiredoxin
VKHSARWIALSVAAVLVVLGVVLALNVGNDPQQASQESRLLDTIAPELDLPVLDGERITSDDLAGKAVLVNFWNTWCRPCHEELPALKQFWREHQGDGDVVMVGIVRDDTKGRVARYVDDEGIDWTIALDPGSQAALDFATRGQPETFAISPSGRIVGYQLSEMSVPGLEAMLDAARQAR